MNTQHPQHQNGFTLVELAIVLMIIGLLVGGILRGQELMENARVASTVQQVKSYQGAYHTFQDSYNAKPGDMAQALNRIPGCDAGNGCGNGDGNGMIGQTGLNQGTNINQANQTGAPFVETSYFWKHLAMAHLITTVELSSPISPATWGRTHPMAKIGGGFTVLYTTAAATGTISGDKGYGNILRLQGSPTSTGNDAYPAISPLRASQVDRKMDDGLGDSGFVTADHEWNCDPDGNYLQTAEITCYMYFMMD